MDKVKGLRYKRTLYVGLGGAGAKTLRMLKQKIKAANGGDVPKQIKFLIIDTNATELSNFRDFDCSEKLCIAVREPYQRYLHDKDLATHNFIPKQNTHSLLALERGAGQIRSNGHFAVIENQYSNRLVRIFRERADEIEDIDINGSTLEKDPKIEVRLVFSIAGGTGSGTFLPIATLLRTAIKHCELTAYIYSASHYSKKVENSAKYSVMQNAYAALCELDYMMHFGRKDRNYENVKFNFGPDVTTQQIELQNRPFEEVYYIDKHTSLPYSDSVEFAYNEIDRLQENTAEAMHVAATNIISAHTGTVDNVRQKIMEGQFDVGDKFAWVSGLGIAELYFNELDENNQDVINACKTALDARVNTDSKLSEEIVEKIATSFIQLYKFDESHGKDDNDPILKKFAEEDDIREKCIRIVNAAVADGENSDYFNNTIEDFIPQNRTSEKIQDETIEKFKEYINQLLISLIDDDSFKEYQIKGYSEGLSFGMVKSILKKIDEKLGQSVKKLESEKEEYKHKKESADKLIEKELNNNKPSTPTKPKKRRFWPFGSVEITEENVDTENNNTYNNIAIKVRGLQVEGLTNKILNERCSKAIKIFTDCQKYIDYVCENMLDKWQAAFKDALKYAHTKKGHNGLCDDTQKHENKVEVQMVELKGGFRLDYKTISTTAMDYNNGILQSPQAVYDRVSSMLKKVSGSLQQYLTRGVQEILSLTDDKRVKVDRTPCQKKIDRLIDLATPTMQVDRHGYGDRVKDDQFWYIMTDCPETTIDDKTDCKDDKNKSVGELLKNLIEQNTLDARINLVHVPGWHNKALLYRVISAVPPYFVDGVCISTEGGYTLEFCYEELKKTKRTYTPFSHEFLRSKLEKGITVLKPHDSIDKGEAMEHWVNFNLLGYIHFESVKGTKGLYSIMSNGDGEVLTNDLSDDKKIMVLGESRTEAFETFSRYCKSFVDEREEYKELNNPLEDLMEYEKLVNMTGEEYMTQVLQGLKWKNEIISDWKELKKHLSKEDPEHEMLRAEISFVNNRQQEYIELKNETIMNETLSNSFSNDN